MGCGGVEVEVEHVVLPQAASLLWPALLSGLEVGLVQLPQQAAKAKTSFGSGFDSEIGIGT